jgi:hypothetical protein
MLLICAFFLLRVFFFANFENGGKMHGEKFSKSDGPGSYKKQKGPTSYSESIPL